MATGLGLGLGGPRESSASHLNLDKEKLAKLQQLNVFKKGKFLTKGIDQEVVFAS